MTFFQELMAGTSMPTSCCCNQPQLGERSYLHGAILGSGSSNKLSLAHSRWLRMCFSHIHSPPSCTSDKHTEFVNFMSHFMLQTNQHSAKGPLFKRAPFVSHQIAVSNLCITKAYTKAPSSPWPCPESPGPFGGRCYILRDLGIFQTNPTEAGKWIQTTQQKQLTKKNNDQIFFENPKLQLFIQCLRMAEKLFFFLDKTAVFVRCFLFKKTRVLQ